ncbi:unnamed protein product [Brassica oleracea var. botrytis]|uniref:Uncharacterized protein n=2 Tax=Brassica TaxID=3705 RepID=A0A3P6BZV1_BRAOL|nr:unnamed protein product [Brassica napus]VDD08416.1 unnamed protein product [Brassica oleracea]
MSSGGEETELNFDFHGVLPCVRTRGMRLSWIQRYVQAWTLMNNCPKPAEDNIPKNMEYGMGLTPCPFCDVGKFEYRVTEQSQKDCLTTNTHEACLPIHENCSMMAELMVLSKISMVLTAHGSNRIVYVTDDHVDISTSNRVTGRSAVALSLYRLLNSRVCF